MKLRPKTVDMKSLKLSPEEGFVLSRVDGPCSIRDLVALTGLDEGRVVEIVGRLASSGAVDVDGGPPAEPAAAVTTPQGRVGPATHARKEREEQEEERQEEPEADAAEDEEIPPSDPGALDEEETPEELQSREAQERNYRQIYEAVFHPMEKDARAQAAQTEEGANLMALCLDADPQIIHAVLSNHRVGLDHARMIAQYHRTQAGLDMVGRRTEFVSDAQVQRRLLANPMVPDALLRKIVNPKLIMDVYKICINREYPERSRVKVRELLQKKFMLGSADERAALLIKTEGRCLILLTGVALDARTTQILVAKTTYSPLFIQNLARWSATPPALLAHLLKQPLVRSNPGMRKLLLKHPNMPSEAKRHFQ